MADETTNLVLEHLRSLRADIASFREETRRGLSALSSRVDGLETEVRGVNYVVTVSIGSLPAEIKDIKERVQRLENA